MLRQNSSQNIFSLTEVTGVSGSVIFPIIPCDWSVAVAKLYNAGFAGTSPTLDVYLQTQDPQTGTFFDVAHFAQETGAVTEANAVFVSFGKPQGYVGVPGQSHIAAGTVSGLPLLSRTMKVVYTYGGTVGTSTATLSIDAVDQDIPG